ncbi:hypothetical protein A7X66_09265 [Stenotrophomonas maltophilia]|nr:hypothetical protein A7X66_09265 [Stenotrophomonas maltophilia]
MGFFRFFLLNLLVLRGAPTTATVLTSGFNLGLIARNLFVRALVMPAGVGQGKELIQYRLDGFQLFLRASASQTGNLFHIGGQRFFLQVVPAQEAAVDGVLDQRQVGRRCCVVTDVMFKVVHGSSGLWAFVTADREPRAAAAAVAGRTLADHAAPDEALLFQLGQSTGQHEAIQPGSTGQFQAGEARVLADRRSGLRVLLSLSARRHDVRGGFVAAAGIGVASWMVHVGSSALYWASVERDNSFGALSV